jgi:hypothetical protein
MLESDYARIAYEAYAAHQPWHASPDGTRGRAVLVPWELLPQREKDAWEAAIDAAFNAQIPGDAP